ncbi:HlyD family efflux transporter periplasmic adaptor subunit [uncultured Cetobacterium sp.]|uniref:efflux RND transporter periplasmic adaptor subunit n=1 Tax=uncultured Cetobacterium sp. TaxID=527638 RepID=UPI0026160886|nr:HlyD family efflux transporter periplasmic adaptor subunit [uncultured Cetobacterium sp.]
MNKKIIIGIIALVLVGGAVFKKKDIFLGKEVKVERLEKNSLSSSALYGGVVAPSEIVPVYIEAPALIESIEARVGQEVNPGDKLMTFSSKSVIENSKDLKINELDIKNVELQVADLEGGSLKLELDNRKLEMKNIKEKVRGDERRIPVITSEARTLREKANAYEKLLAQDGVSSTEAERAKTEADKKSVELEDLKTALDLNRQKYELMAVSYESLTRELEISEAKLKAQLEKLKLNNDILVRRESQLKQPLLAPIKGVITKIDVQEGSNVFSGERLLAISPSGENIVKVEVPMYQAGSIELNQRAKVVSNGYEGEVEYDGYVSRVSSVARESILGNRNEKVIEVEVKIQGENNLKPGFITDVEIASENRKKVLTVNSFSVVEEGDKNFVYIVEDGVAKKTPIKVGARTSTEFEVLNLNVGTDVVINPFKVKDGEKVKAVI